MSLSPLLLVLLLVCSSEPVCFWGTVMTYYPKNTNSDGSVEVVLRSKMDFAFCADLSWECLSGNCGPEDAVWNSVDAENAEPWCQTEGISTRLLPSNAPFQLWLDIEKWNDCYDSNIMGQKAVALVELRNRSDTGKANTSPQTTILPVRVPSNCQRDFSLLSFDADGDDVKCRFEDTALSECNACTPQSVLSLSSPCTLSFSPTSSSNEGPYTVQLVMEDFPRQTITLTETNGSQMTITTNNAISKIPVQFVLTVDPVVPSCTEGLYLPRFLSPTPTNQAQFYTLVNQSLEINIKAEAKISTISDLLFSGPYNINLTPSVPGQYMLSWTPSQNEDGENHSICFVVQAISNSLKYHSDLRCVVVTVGNDPKITASSTTATQAATPSTSTILTTPTATSSQVTTTTPTATPLLTTAITTITTPTETTPPAISTTTPLSTPATSTTPLTVTSLLTTIIATPTETTTSPTSTSPSTTTAPLTTVTFATPTETSTPAKTTTPSTTTTPLTTTTIITTTPATSSITPSLTTMTITTTDETTTSPTSSSPITTPLSTMAFTTPSEITIPAISTTTILTPKPTAATSTTPITTTPLTTTTITAPAETAIPAIYVTTPLITPVTLTTKSTTTPLTTRITTTPTEATTVAASTVTTSLATIPIHTHTTITTTPTNTQITKTTVPSTTMQQSPVSTSTTTSSTTIVPLSTITKSTTPVGNTTSTTMQSKITIPSNITTVFSTSTPEIATIHKIPTDTTQNTAVPSTAALTTKSRPPPVIVPEDTTPLPKSITKASNQVVVGLRMKISSSPQSEDYIRNTLIQQLKDELFIPGLPSNITLCLVSKERVELQPQQPLVVDDENV